jgi:hypothetical protein
VTVPTPIPNIWQLQSQGDVDALIEALRHSEATVRKGAAAALRAISAWQAVPALQAALAAEQDWQAHAAIAAALQYLNRGVHIEHLIQNKDIQGLAKMLVSPNLEDVKTACRALAEVGNRQAVEPLVILFRNPLMPNAARLAAAEALLKLESAPAVVTLLGALRRDNWQVRRNAAAVLGQLQAGWATDALIAALNDPHQAVQRTAAAALRRIGSPEAIQAANAYDELQKHVGTQPLTAPEETPASAEVPQPTATIPEAPTIPPVVAPVASPTPDPAPTPTPDATTRQAPVVEPAASSPPVPTPTTPPPDLAATKAAISRMAKWVETREVAAVSSTDVPEVSAPPPSDGQAKPVAAEAEKKPLPEPPSASDDTKPSRPTQLRSPFQQAQNTTNTTPEQKPDGQ